MIPVASDNLTMDDIRDCIAMLETAPYTYPVGIGRKAKVWYQVMSDGTLVPLTDTGVARALNEYYGQSEKQFTVGEVEEAIYQQRHGDEPI